MSDNAEMYEIASELSRSLCGGRVTNSSVFVSTAVAYPNGVGVSVRIDHGRNGYIVSDDGYAHLIAETMQTLPAFNRIAPGVAARSGILFEKGTFLISEVERKTLPAAVSLVANSSSRSIERMVASLEQPRVKRVREVFDKRLREAFGDAVKFNLEYRGSTGRKWEFDAGVERDGSIVRLFELVSPSTQAVALANMKIADTAALRDAPKITAALADYDKTEPELRAILSNAGGSVISAKDDISKYKIAA